MEKIWSDALGTVNDVIAGAVLLAPYLVVLTVALLLFGLLYDLITPYHDKELIRGDRGTTDGAIAVVLSRSGAYVGITVAMIGSLIMNPTQGLGDRLQLFGVDGLAIVATFCLLYWPLDWAVLYRIPNCEELQRGNIAVAWVEFSVYVGLGLIMGAAFSGGGQDWWPGLGSALMFTVFGVVTLLAVYRLYVFCRRVFTYDIKVEGLLCRNDLGTAADASSVILALSIVIACAIAGDFTGWVNDITTYVAAALTAIPVVMAWRAFARWSLRKMGYGDSDPAEILAAFTVLGVGTLMGVLLVI